MKHPTPDGFHFVAPYYPCWRFTHGFYACCNYLTMTVLPYARLHFSSREAAEAYYNLCPTTDRRLFDIQEIQYEGMDPRAYGSVQFLYYNDLGDGLDTAVSIDATTENSIMRVGCPVPAI